MNVFVTLTIELMLCFEQGVATWNVETTSIEKKGSQIMIQEEKSWVIETYSTIPQESLCSNNDRCIFLESDNDRNDSTPDAVNDYSDHSDRDGYQEVDKGEMTDGVSSTEGFSCLDISDINLDFFSQEEETEVNEEEEEETEVNEEEEEEETEVNEDEEEETEVNEEEEET